MQAAAVSSFDRAMEHVRREEGGLVHHPRDPGKLTNFGITQATLESSRAFLWMLPRSVESLTWEQAKGIYRHHYWAPVRGDELPYPYALVTVDAAINCGVQRAIRWLQAGVGTAIDGWIGAKTLQAAMLVRVESLIEMAARRAYHYMLQDSIDDDFGLGWARRAFRIHTAALQEVERV